VEFQAELILIESSRAQTSSTRLISSSINTKGKFSLAQDVSKKKDLKSLQPNKSQTKAYKNQISP